MELIVNVMENIIKSMPHAIFTRDPPAGLLADSLLLSVIKVGLLWLSVLDWNLCGRIIKLLISLKQVLCTAENFILKWLVSK